MNWEEHTSFRMCYSYTFVKLYKCQSININGNSLINKDYTEISITYHQTKNIVNASRNNQNLSVYLSTINIVRKSNISTLISISGRNSSQ